MFILTLAALTTCVWLTSGRLITTSKIDKIDVNNDANAADHYEAALDYSKENNGLSLLIYQDGQIVLENYHNGYSAKESHMLASGTKSFAGLLLALLIQEGYIKNFDDKVSSYLEEWINSDKENITFRELLGLYSGLEAGDNGKLQILPLQ